MSLSSSESFWRLELGVWFLELIPSPPKFIGPTVPRLVNIGDFAHFMCPNIHSKQVRILEIQTNQKRVLQKIYVTLSADSNPGLAWHNA
jgi:hypothetical protein